MRSKKVYYIFFIYFELFNYILNLISNSYLYQRYIFILYYNINYLLYIFSIIKIMNKYKYYRNLYNKNMPMGRRLKSHVQERETENFCSLRLKTQYKESKTYD